MLNFTFLENAVKRPLFFFLLLLGSLFLVPKLSRATHIMGGEITWKCNGNGEYDFTITTYRDCAGFNGSFRTPLYIHNYPSPNVVTRLATSTQFTDVDSIDISPKCAQGIILSCASGDPAAVEKNVATVKGVQLNGVPPPEGWIITFSDGNRNPNNNLDPSGHPFFFRGITLRAKIFRHSGTVSGECTDNSPTFRETATSLICAGSQFTYNHNASDDELDSLIYEWGKPLINNQDFRFPGLFPDPFVEGSDPEDFDF